MDSCQVMLGVKFVLQMQRAEESSIPCLYGNASMRRLFPRVPRFSLPPLNDDAVGQDEEKNSAEPYKFAPPFRKAM